MIDKASVFAERFKNNPQILQATVLGQGKDPNLDPYTALRALQLIKESNAMAMARQAQGQTSAPSLASQAVAPQGLAAMMPMGAPAGQMPQQMGQQAPQGMPPQAPAMQASGGLANMPTPEENYASGGIIAFSGEDESLVTDPLTLPPDTPFNPDETGIYQEDSAGGSAANQNLAMQNYLESRKGISAVEDNDFTPEENKKVRQDYLDFTAKNAGPDIYAPANTNLDTREQDRAKNRSQGQGLALLAAAGAILEGNTLARGASKAFPAFAKEMGEVQRADTAEQRSIEQMRFALADAQRKERMGDVRGAQAAVETARRARTDANKFKFNKAIGLANLDVKAIQGLRPVGRGAGAGGLKLAEQLAAAEVAYLKDPTAENKATLDGLTSAAAKTRTSFSTAESGPNKLGGAADITSTKVISTENTKAQEALSKFKIINPSKWKKMVSDAGSESAATAAYKKDWITSNAPSVGSGTAASPIKLD